MCNHQLMVETQEIRDAFVARLNSALDQVPGVRPGRGRNVDLYEGIKDHLSAKASKQATHKWLRGESMPSRGNMIAIADWLKVRVEWLAHGEGEMRYTGSMPQKQSELLAAGMAIFNKVTPRSQALIEQISELDAQGKLTDDDIKALQQIIRRFGTSK